MSGERKLLSPAGAKPQLPQPPGVCRRVTEEKQLVGFQEEELQVDAGRKQVLRPPNVDHQAEQEVCNLELNPGKNGKLILTNGPD